MQMSITFASGAEGRTVVTTKSVASQASSEAASPLTYFVCACAPLPAIGTCMCSVLSAASRVRKGRCSSDTSQIIYEF